MTRLRPVPCPPSRRDDPPTRCESCGTTVYARDGVCAACSDWPAQELEPATAPKERAA